MAWPALEHCAEWKLVGIRMEDQNTNINFPLDLCDWASPETLRFWVQEELKHVTGSEAPAEKQNALIGILAFAYARGIFDSEEIINLCRTDKLYSSLQGGSDFSWEDLLATRHQHRGVLVTLMVRLLTRALVEKGVVSQAALDPALKRRLHESAVDRLDNARNMDRGEEE